MDSKNNQLLKQLSTEQLPYAYSIHLIYVCTASYPTLYYIAAAGHSIS